jgi:hypothetical protein
VWAELFVNQQCRDWFELLPLSLPLLLLQAPSIPVVRRHARSEGGQFQFAPAVQVWVQPLPFCFAAVPVLPYQCCRAGTVLLGVRLCV